MNTPQLLENIALLAADAGNETDEDGTPRISLAEIFIKRDSNKYRIINVEYDKEENEFLLEVGEDG